MRSEAGLTLVEISLAMAIIALLAGMAILSGVTMLRSAEASRILSQLADELTIARANAIARSETWRIRFTPPVSGSTVVRSWVVEARKPGGTWAVQEGPYELPAGLGLQVPFESSVPVPLQFNRFGRFGHSQNTDLTLCAVQVNPGGVEDCQTGGSWRTMRLEAYTGAIGY